jgi:hypothetical protein
MGIKEKLINSPLMLHSTNSPCPPPCVQSWLIWFWEDPDSTLEGKWKSCSVKGAIQNALLEEADESKSRKQVLGEWGFEDDEAEELLNELE